MGKPKTIYQSRRNLIILKFSFLNLKEYFRYEKAKAFLIATAILGVVGGAVGFKAHTKTTNYCYSTNTTGSGLCPTPITGTPVSGTTNTLSYVQASDCTSATCTAVANTISTAD